jgi:hypothetical protein
MGACEGVGRGSSMHLVPSQWAISRLASGLFNPANRKMKEKRTTRKVSIFYIIFHTFFK